MSINNLKDWKRILPFFVNEINCSLMIEVTSFEECTFEFFQDQVQNS